MDEDGAKYLNLAEQVLEPLRESFHADIGDVLAFRIADALRAAREDALEDAAKVADDSSALNLGPCGECALIIVKAIRALKEKE